MPAGLLYIFDSSMLVGSAGLLIACLMIYGSTGLFFCFFIPSGAILFAAGMLVATGGLHYSIYIVCISLIVACFLGNLTGYWVGLKAGPLLYKKADSRFFRQRHLKTAETFYRKYGALTLTIGLYLPLVRTFASVVAGMVRLNFQRFLLLSGAGSAIWTASFVLAGYLTGSMPFLKKWSTHIIAGFLLIVTVPLVYRVIKEFKKLRKQNESNNRKT